MRCLPEGYTPRAPGVGRAGMLVEPGGPGNTTVAPSDPPTDGVPGPGPANAPGAALTLTDLTWRGSEADGTSTVAGVTLHVPPGQSVALHSVPPGDAAELLNIVAGLRRPQSGQVTVDEVAVERLSGPALDDYVASRGLLNARLPLVPWLSAADNVLAALPPGQPDDPVHERAAQLLAITGVTHLTGPVGALTAEQQWRILIARGLRLSPRLVLATDPTPGLDSRAATAVLDLLMDVQAQFGFTLLLTIGRQATASHCQRLVRVVRATVVEDVLIKDDPWTRDRVDRIG
jgi:putative ABC transport system ATP-binding protein